jgi:hypothetical protein
MESALRTDVQIVLKLLSVEIFVTGRTAYPKGIGLLGMTPLTQPKGQVLWTTSE